MDERARESPGGAGHAVLETAADRAALSAILEARGRRREARNALHQALTLTQNVLGADHYEVGLLLDRLAGLLIRDGQLGEGAALYGRALEIFERTLGSLDPRTMTCRANRDNAVSGSHP